MPSNNRARRLENVARKLEASGNGKGNGKPEAEALEPVPPTVTEAEPVTVETVPQADPPKESNVSETIVEAQVENGETEVEASDEIASDWYNSTLVFTGVNGPIRLALADVPAHCKLLALRRTWAHVFGNESDSSAGSMAGKKGETRDKKTIKAELQDNYLKAILDGSWASRTRGPRMPSANREEAIYNGIIYKEVRQLMQERINRHAVTKAKVEGEEAWTGTDGTVTISTMAKRYLENNNPHPTAVKEDGSPMTVGEERIARHKQQAADNYAHELRMAEQRKLNKAASAPLVTESLDTI